MRCRALAVVLFAGLLASAPARAFERSRTRDGSDIFLFWRHRSVQLRVAFNSSDEVPPERVEAVVARSVAAWNQAARGCPSDFSLTVAGPATGTRTALDGADADGENRIVWRETGWPSMIDPATLAITTVSFQPATGQIVDADIDFNGQHHAWSDLDPPLPGAADAENTLTHELGHLLGLAHVGDPEATMFASSEIGEVSKRTLGDDDIAGLCFVYPEGILSPGAPLDGRPRLTSSWACRAAPASSGGAAWLALLALSLLRRRRADRRSGAPAGTACASNAAGCPRGAPSRARRGSRR